MKRKRKNSEHTAKCFYSRWLRGELDERVKVPYCDCGRGFTDEELGRLNGEFLPGLL